MADRKGNTQTLSETEDKNDVQPPDIDASKKASVSALTYEVELRKNTIKEIEDRRKTRKILLWTGMVFGFLAIIWGITLHPVIIGVFKWSNLIISLQLDLWHMIPLVAFTAAATFLLISAHRRIEVADLIRSGADVVARSQGDTGI